MRTVPGSNNHEGMLDMEYIITTDVIVTRRSIVEADSPEAALERFQAGDREIIDVSDEMSGWEEQEHTAQVIGVMTSCELCGDERLEEDLNEDQRCPPGAEREERNETEGE